MANKKGVLFLTAFQSGLSAKGGTEIAVARNTTYLRGTEKYRLYNIFILDSQPSYNIDLFDQQTQMKLKELPKKLPAYIIDNEIDIIINEGGFYIQQLLINAIKKSERNVKILFVHHLMPGGELKGLTFRFLVRDFYKNKKRMKNFIKISLYPFFRFRNRMILRKLYRFCHDNTVKVVLKSEGNIDEYARFAKLSKKDKFTVIPNMIDIPSKRTDLSKKKKVLIMSRLDERSKGISYALKVWEKISRLPELSEWELDVIGDGPDKLKYLKIGSTMKNINFYGWCHPRYFLDNSSIILITSRHEGFCMSLVEAQAAGCVPIAFNSFPALRDLITHGSNGVVVERFGDVDTFENELIHLMQDYDYRKKLSENAETSSRRFFPEVIGKEWEKLLDSL